MALNRFANESTEEKLNSKTVYVNVCGKYADMSAMASRTLMVNPTPEQKQAYKDALEAQELLISKLTVGSAIKDAYLAAREHLNKARSDLGVSSNFGFGIGFNYKEESLVINGENETKIRPGMTFHVRVHLLNVCKSDPERATLAIGDTVEIGENGAKVLTRAIVKKYAEISYELDESDAEEEQEEVKKNGKDTSKSRTNGQNKKKKDDSSEEEAEDDDDEDGLSEGSNEIRQQSLMTTSRLRSKNNDNA